MSVHSQDVEDLVAETFLSVVPGLGSFEWKHENSFAAWVFRIAHNLVSNFYRDGERAGLASPFDALPETPACNPLPEDVLLQREMFAHLRVLGKRAA